MHGHVSKPSAFLLLTLCIVPARLSAAEPKSETGCSCSAQCNCISSRCGRWFVAETDNFQACCLDSESSAKLLAEGAEQLRRKLQTKWLGGEAQRTWSPKCQIVLHLGLNSYVSACGRGSEHTVGSSLVRADEGRVRIRRIDLLGDRTDFLSAALPHELTHVVLKDLFPSTTVPRWADEGAAILADTEAKQTRHFKDFEDALARRTLFDTASLITTAEYPLPERMGAFYGQSVSLVEYLIEQKKPQQFVEFIRIATEKGYDSALRECYGISDVGELDRRWRRSISAKAGFGAVLAAK
jgi:hypothetical protein